MAWREIGKDGRALLRARDGQEAASPAGPARQRYQKAHRGLVEAGFSRAGWLC